MNLRSRLIAAFRRTRGFTLVEVLLGIMILALGLLGLAAVFPLVVKQQRESQDTVVGLSVAKAAEAMLRGNRGLNNPADDANATGGWAKVSWVLFNEAHGKSGGRIDWNDVFTQSTFGNLPPVYGTLADQAGKLPGTFRVPSDLGAQNDVVLKTSDRLLPAPVNGGVPQFIWDCVPVPASPVDTSAALPGTPTFFPLRIVVFVRRLDPGIRVPAGQTLGQAIANGAVIPVAADNDGNATLDGRGKYALFFSPKMNSAYRRFGASGGAFTVIDFPTASSQELGAARQVGQQLVDVDGNIYTVVALPDESDQPYSGKNPVVISPGIPSEILTSPNSTSSTVLNGRTPSMLCTAQIPAAVSTFVVTR